MATNISIPVPAVTVDPPAVTVTPPALSIPDTTLLGMMPTADVVAYLKGLGYGVTPPSSGTTPPTPSTESPDPTSVTTVGPTINASPTPGTAGSGNVLAITAGKQISLNGVVPAAYSQTANVVQLYYTKHTAYQLNAAGEWYGPITAANAGTAPVASPLPGATPPPSSGIAPIPPLLGVMNQGLAFNVGPGGSVGTTQTPSWAYLASQGVQLMRNWFLWEQVQASLGGAINSNWVNTYLIPAIDAAWAAGIKTIPCCGNYAAFPFGSGNVWGNSITPAQTASLWAGLSKLLKGHPGVWAYDLMNEPVLNGTWPQQGQICAQHQQACINAIRGNGDTTEVWVEAANNGGSNYTDMFPGGPSTFVTDPANNFVYSFHLYPNPLSENSSYIWDFNTWAAKTPWAYPLSKLTSTFFDPMFAWGGPKARWVYGEWGCPSYQGMIQQGKMSPAAATASYKAFNDYFTQLMAYMKSKNLYTNIQFEIGEGPLQGAPFCNRTSQTWPFLINATTTSAGIIFPKSNWSTLWS